jgi:hypothetical protein
MSTIINSSSTPTVHAGPVKFSRIAAEPTSRGVRCRDPPAALPNAIQDACLSDDVTIAQARARFAQAGARRCNKSRAISLRRGPAS